MLRRSLLLAAGAVAGPALAQEPTTVEALVVSGAPFAVSIDSTTTHVDIVDAAELARQRPGGLGEVLESLPGVRSTAYGPGATRPVIRGQSGQRVLVLQNGVGLVDASALSPDHAVAADPSQASRIEVIRGPSALAYGGSAIGGVVNVIDDRIAERAPAGGRSGRASASAESVNDGAAGSFAVRAGADGWVVALDGEARESGDYTTPVRPLSARLAAEEGLTASGPRRQLNSDVRLTAVGAGLSRVAEGGFVGVSVKRTETEYGVPFVQATAPLDHGPIGIDLGQTRLDARAQAPVDLWRFDRARLSVGYADYRHAEIDRGAGGAVGTQFFSHGTEARLELIEAEDDGRQGAVGVQALTRRLSAVGDEAFIPSSRTREAGAFALQRYDRGGWGIEAGLRLDRRSVEAELFGRPTSPIAQSYGLDWSAAAADQDFGNVSASLGAFARPGEGLFLALSLSRNARAPTEFELYSDGPHEGTGTYQVGDPGLGSEKVTSAEATARYRRGRLRLEGHAYAARYDGFIDERPTGDAVDDGGDPADPELPVFRFVQTRADFTGGELEAGFELLQGEAGSVWLDLVFDTVRGSTPLGPPARVPPPSLSARLSYEGARLDAAVTLRRVRHQDRIAPFELPTDGHARVDLSVGYRPFEGREATLFLDVDNLTNAEIREHVSFLKDIAPAAGRSVRIGVSGRY